MAKNSRFKIWSSQNKRDNGKSEDIGVLETIKTSKQREYQSLLSQLTDHEKIRMREILHVAKSQIEFLSRLEDEGIDVRYLIAMNVTTEEDISSYHALRERGIDTYSIQERANKNRVDQKYLREIESMKQVYPNLKNIHGKDIQSTLNKQEYIREDITSFKEESLVKNSKAKTYDTKTEANVSDAPSVEIDLDMLDAESASTETEIKKTKDWQAILSQITSKTAQEVSESVGDTSSTKAPVYLNVNDSVRYVYILADEFATPDIVGYEFIFVKNSQSLSRFTVNKNNLLILTSDIPRYVLNDFAKWLQGVLQSGLRFRVATLKNSPLTHDIVEGELLRLDKKCLDDFYDEHKTESYIGETVGSFLDLSSYLEEEDKSESSDAIEF